MWNFITVCLGVIIGVILIIYWPTNPFFKLLDKILDPIFKRIP